MKNLRKVLALVLVVAMMASLVISASALSAKDYTDYSEVVNKDAVAMLTELGIINGYPAGDFQPSGIVTRAEMAKMIYVVLNSGNDQAPTPDAQRYSDVYKGHWAEGYIAFCDDLGIIDGMGDGTFAPSATVTGVQAAKMLLVAMGYDSAVEGFTGTNWDYGVLKAASAAGLFEGYTAATNEGCTRDNAALLVYNALIGDCVSYVGNTAVATGDTLIGTYYGLVAVTGVVVANEYANLFDSDPLQAGYTEIAFIGDQYTDLFHAIDPLLADWSESYTSLGTIQLGFLEGEMEGATSAYIGAWFNADFNNLPEKYEAILSSVDFTSLKKSVNDGDEYESFVFSTGTTLAQVGQTVTVYAKLKGNYEQFTNIVEYAKYDMFSGKTVGNVVVDDDCVVFYNEGAAGDFSGDIKTDYNTRYFENYRAVWFDVDGTRVYEYDEYDEYDTEASPAQYVNPVSFYFDAQDLTEAVRGEYLWAMDNDGDGIAEIVLKYRQIFAVAEYDSYDDTWTFGDGIYADIDADDVIFDGEELEDGMKVLVVPVDGSYYVKEAETVTGTATEVFYNKEAKEWAVELDGTKYFESGLYWANDIINLNDDDAKAGPDDKAFYAYVNTMEPDEEYKLYFDDFGNIVAYEKTAEPAKTDYFLVTGAAYEVQSLSVTDSIVFGAVASEDTVIGVEAYYVGRTGRANTVIEDVETLFNAATSNSIDKIGVNISNSATRYQYVSYQNVFTNYNDYNNYNIGEDDASHYGWYTTLTQVGFDEDSNIISMDYANTDPDGNLDLTVWQVSGVDVTDPAAEGDGIFGTVGTNVGYVGSDTLFYIYLHDSTLQKSNVITVTGYKNLPILTAASENGGYGIVNVYGIPGSGKSVDAQVVVYELEVDFTTGAGLPVKSVSNFIYVYDVDSWSTGYCQHVYGIDENGAMIELYVDVYDKDSRLSSSDSGWYSYTKTDANIECEKGHDHYELADVDDYNVNTEQEDVYAPHDDAYSYTAGLKTAWLDYIGTILHSDQYWLSAYVDEYQTTSIWNDGDEQWVDLSETKLYIHCNTGSSKYNGMELIPTNFETVEEVEKSGKLDILTDKQDAYEFYDDAIVVYKEEGGKITVIAIIVQYEGNESYSEMASRYAVAESESSAEPVE